MSRPRTQTFRSAEGLTLVELLVVLLLLGVIGGIVSTAISRGLRTDAQTQSRIEAFEDLQIALERVSRDVRAADPIVDVSSDEIVVEVYRSDECLEYTYTLDGSDLIERLRRSAGDCDPGATQSTQVLLRDLDVGADDIFSVDDVDGTEVVTITFTRTLFEQRPVTVSTAVKVRN